MTQLDLGLAADVSARHVSFLETGRAKPSDEMVLRLGATLEVPLRDQNAMLRAAGYQDLFAEPALEGQLPASIELAIERMLAQQEPYPMVVMDRLYNVRRTNQAATRLLGLMLSDATASDAAPLNAMRMLFDPQLARPLVVNWQSVAHGLLSQVHREALHNPQDDGLSDLLDSLLAYPDVPASWRHPDFSIPSTPTFNLRLKRGDIELAFLTTVTVFTAPQNITLDELRLESYFPLDDATEATCHRLAN